MVDIGPEPVQFAVPVGEKVLKPHEVAKLFYVDPKTVTRWAKSGKLSSFRTPGGHHRFKLTDVQAFLNEAWH